MFLYSAKPKRIMSCVIIALLIFTGSISYSPVFANEINIVQYSDSITGGSIYFDVSTGAITDCDTTVTSVIIPDQINGIEVISISSAAFESCTKIETLKLPNTLQSIGARAFTDCKSIKEIIIPEGVESIESQIFHYCSALETVTIPSTVTTIYETAFRECTSLKSIDVSEQNDEYTSKDGVLFYKDMSRICKYPAAKETIEYTIPQTVKYTKKEAFMGAKYLQKLYFPEGFISISENAVRDCKSLKIVELPESLNTIGNYAFYGCTSLEKINILSTDISILNTAFENSPNVVIYGKSGSYVETFAKENNIEFLDSTVNPIVYYQVTGGKLTFDKSTGTIIDCDDSVTKVFIPEKISDVPVKSINADAFVNCNSLESFEVEESNYYYSSIDGVLFNESMNTICKYPPARAGSEYSVPSGVKWSLNNVFRDAKHLERVTFQNGFTTLSYSAFRDCESLKSVDLPDSLDRIDGYAFYGCSALTEIDIPEKVTTYFAYSFGGCTALEEFNISSGVIDIYNTAFVGCTSIKEFTVHPDNTKYCSENGVVFDKSKALLSFYPAGATAKSYEIPETVLTIYSNAFNGAQNLEEIIIPGNVERIWENAFANCQKLKSVTIDHEMQSIDATAFANSQNVVIYGKAGSYAETFAKDNNITFIDTTVNPVIQYQVTGGKITFDKSTGAIIDCEDTVTEAIIPDAIDGIPVTTIERQAFMDCKLLSEVKFPEELLYIRESAFARCDKLKQIDLTDSLRSIGVGAFDSCTSLETIILPKGTFTMMNDVFFGCTSLTSVTIPGNVYDISENSFTSCRNLVNITIENGVKVIGKEAFSMCMSIKELKLPDSIIKIDSAAFNWCSDLNKILIPASIEMIENDAFLQCKNLTIYGTPGSYAETYAKDNGIPFKSAEKYDEPNTDVPSTTPDTPTTDEPEITPEPEQPTITPEPEEPEETPEIIQQNQIIKCSNINTTFYVKGTRKLNASANTKLTYKSSNKKIATVSYTGKVTMINPGKVTITITAAETSEYKGAVKKVTFKSTLKKPALTAKALKGKKNKLTWSKVPGSTGYKLYIYDKSKKKYVCRLTKKASVKSVTHKGLKAGKVYKYKIRAYRIVSGKKVYSPYSAVKTIKARK